MKNVRKFLSGSILLAVLSILFVAQAMDQSGQILGNTRKLENVSVRAGYDGPTVKFTTSDSQGKWIEIPLDEAKLSITIKNMLEDLGGDRSDMIIPLANISRSTLEDVVECLKIMAEKSADASADTAKASVEKAIADQVEKVTKFQEGPEKHNENLKNLERLFNLFLAANYLDIKLLLDVCAKSWGDISSLVSGGTDKELIERVNDLNKKLPLDLNRLAAQYYTGRSEIVTWFSNFFGVHAEKILGKLSEKMFGDDSAQVINTVFISEDGKTIVSGSLFESVNIWKIVDGTWKFIKTLNVTDTPIHLIRLGKDGKPIVLAGGNRSNINIWKEVNGTFKSVTKNTFESIDNMSASEDGKMFILGKTIVCSQKAGDTWSCVNIQSSHKPLRVLASLNNDDKTIIVRSIKDQFIKVFKENSDGSWSSIANLNSTIANSDHIRFFSGDGKTLVTQSRKGFNFLKEVDGRWLSVATLDHQDNDIKPDNKLIAISKDGKTFVKKAMDDTINVCKEKVDGTWSCVATLDYKKNESDKLQSKPSSVFLSEDGKTLIVMFDDLQARVWKDVDDRWLSLATTSYSLSSFSYGKKLLISLSKDAKTLVLGIDENKSLKIIDLSLIEVLHNFFAQLLTLEQCRFFNLVMQEKKVGQTLDLTKPENAYFKEIFNTLPPEIMKLLKDQNLVVFATQPTEQDKQGALENVPAEKKVVG